MSWDNILDGLIALHREVVGAPVAAEAVRPAETVPAGDHVRKAVPAA